MTAKKFEHEINTLKKFFTIYCQDKHTEQFEKNYNQSHYRKTSFDYLSAP